MTWLYSAIEIAAFLCYLEAALLNANKQLSDNQQLWDSTPLAAQCVRRFLSTCLALQELEVFHVGELQ